MTEARICNNCGKVEEGTQAYGSMFARLGEGKSRSLDFCKECTEVLLSSVEVDDEMTDSGEWNFTPEGNWNIVEGDEE